MKKFVVLLLGITALFQVPAYAQNLTQTVRGTLVDIDSKMPLIGATVVVANSDPLIATTTDLDGNFKLVEVPVGRITLQFSYIGYETITMASVVVNSGKEVVLEINMTESLTNLDEIEVSATKNNGEALNEMAMISARSISTEQTERYAGSFNDPSRILSNFAGVTSTQDGSNDIIVRGNSPKYVQWRLEGIEITNPNHFEDQNSSAGGVSALNNNLLATSDFYTGAFSAEFGNVLSGVYDVRLRNGNNEKMEGTFGIGILGTDFTLEGPFKKGYGGSYLMNVRNSTISLINELGLVDIDGILNFQDATVKFNLPTENAGTFSVFGLGGTNSFKIEDVKPSLWETPGDNSMKTEITEDFDKKNHLLNTGVSHVFSLNEKSYLRTTVSYSSNGINDDIYESTITETITGTDTVRDTSDRVLTYQSRIHNWVYRAATTYNYRFDARNKINLGAKYGLHAFDNRQSTLDRDHGTRVPLVYFDGKVNTLRTFINWKHRLNKKVTLVSGLHNMNVLLNGKSTLEPRVAANYQFNPTSSVHVGYGSHSNMERVHNYFTVVTLDNGERVQPNKDLGLLKAHHYVVGYKKQCNKNMAATIEVYYQSLYNLPVENDDDSYYATINEGTDFNYVELVNEGTGKNYGVELTIERFFTDDYYFLINTSLYDSKYTAKDGIERNTQYNGEYLVNLLCGKEFQGLGRKKNKVLALDAKVFFGGGRKIIPLLRDENGELAVNPDENQYWDYDEAYKNHLEDVYQITLSTTYKINRAKATHEIFLNLDNITNTKGKISEYYDEGEPNSIGYKTQFGFFPNLMYRVHF